MGHFNPVNTAGYQFIDELTSDTFILCQQYLACYKVHFERPVESATVDPLLY